MRFETLMGWILASALNSAGAWRARCASLWAVLVLLLITLAPAHALEPILIDPEKDRVDVTALGELYEGRGDKLQIETVAGADGIVGRMTVEASTTGTNPNWIVFALKNGTDKPIVRWLTAQRYTLVGSSVFWPDL
ncbi:MAG: hypothetical protein KAI80_00425, partial [Hyphomicrobiaceae bacterium]|nr:hypothetical protein [Hyphomicrobiaceae bacterium]